MGKSTTGPDWTDIANWMRENEKLTGYEYTLLITPGGYVGGLPLDCTVLATEKGLGPWREGSGFSLRVSWPDKVSATFEGAVFRALVSMDAMIYQQRAFGMQIPR